MKKFLIVGQGLAGTILSMRMNEKQIPHDVIDDNALSSKSSRIAAGLINPIVLKRFKIVHEAISFIDSAKPFYQEWENTLNTSFYIEQDIAHLLHSQEEQNLWLEKSANSPFSRFMKNVEPGNIDALKSPFGVGMMAETAWLKTEIFLNAYRSFLKSKNGLIEKQISIKSLSSQFPDHIPIICNGHLLKNSIPEEAKIFTPTRGEVLIISTNEIPEDFIYHSGIFILPLGNSLFKVGATYHWNNLFDTPSEEGKTKLIEGLEKIFSGSYQIVDHLAGVRPNTSDRKPLLGKFKEGYVFNGLGSRGVLMAPLLSKMLLESIFNGKPIPPEYNINRFSNNL